MPAPYRKACTHCAKSKRRCDLILPSCSRCQQRSLACQYDAREAENISPAMFFTHDPTSHVNGAQNPEQQAIEQTIHFLVPTQGDTTGFPPDFDRDWPALMTSLDDFVVPDQVPGHHSHERGVLAGDIYQERIVYALKKLQTYPSKFVREVRTPFIHQALYRENMPEAIQDALAICGLYYARNATNQNFVFTTIRNKARRLVEQYDGRQVPVFEQLAAIQALVFYQIIRLFDGDIGLRADAERNEGTLINWARQMMLRINQSAADACLDLRSQDSFMIDPWRGWMFAESQRRTLMVCFMLKGLYCFLKNGYDDAKDDFKNLTFFAQAKLWNAPSEFYWRQTIEQHRLLPVLCQTWDADMAGAEPADVDELCMTIMILMKGVDYCSQWLGLQYLEAFDLALPCE